MRATHRNDGSTLVEMIVSMTVASVVVAQVFVVLSTQQAVYAGNERVVEAQQDARLVVEMIQADVRMAGFLIPPFAGISNRDGGTGGTDALCVSDASVIDESMIVAADSVLSGAVVTTTVGAAASSVALDASTLDIDGDGDDDFTVGQGIILADSSDTHCAFVKLISGGTVSFSPPPRPRPSAPPQPMRGPSPPSSTRSAARA